MRDSIRGSNLSSRVGPVVFVLVILGVAAGAAAQSGFPPEVRSPQRTTTGNAEEGGKVEASPRLSGHRETYLLFGTYEDNPNGIVDGFEEVQHSEVKFQVSVRYRIWSSEQGVHKMVAAYTNTSFWQLYNWSESAPFRTTDHEPEIFYEGNMTVDENRPQYLRLGGVHESNGEGPDLSRSWNRLFAEYLVG